ncbi:S41 family peptidase [Helicobacter heilmannii]|uniref:Carboxyl-terminal protease n=1 Tax=Helicobacter heilmannii TaxID=35817 RepID=A0A0K2Y537_HELHE|nr:S41 family peptidase [Helicobacter heilmannii]CCM11809.1 Carboxyl-terminal protease [Helicobacter heilmannii ASB1.4]CRF46428.1 CARBOXYL-TERMINAL PROTEASE [Helicobacter heilmannii]CRF48307.1 CARBOXYL-TERMINAL PROTEASE [Helicobacter heilmannii]CRF50107.1 CARBOXYL-TERMINAL PROTEASE [Helicobacter heilmannii]CRF51434.1 CARBOXYL-TERMINAL PROTEASE [Helicobacter heilmannii]
MNKYFLTGLVSSILGMWLVAHNLPQDEVAQNGSHGKIFKKNNKPTTQERLNALKKFSNVVEEVEHYYVDQVSINDIVDKAIDGLMTNLDAHSSYLTPKKFRDFRAQTEGEFGGLGITVGIRDGALTVIAPLDDTPAFKAGIKAGDVILKINQESTLNMSIDNAVNLMRGKPKTPIELTLVRKNESKPIVVKMLRDIIKIKSVHAKKIEGTHYLYVRVNSFDRNVVKGVLTELSKAKNLQGIVLDLRSNPGGLLNQAIDLSNLFIKHGIIVSQKGRVKAEDIEYRANGKAPYPNLPIAVLVNAGTASASEIVSGALQDHKRAVIIGESTFGKGSVQTTFPVGRDEAIKITIARYYLPSGRTIQAVGIKPDIVVYPGNVPQDESKFSIKEADLKHHLQQELQSLSSKSESKKHEHGKKVEDKESKPITQKDINADIQLKTAIDTLKVWDILTAPNKESAHK